MSPQHKDQHFAANEEREAESFANHRDAKRVQEVLSERLTAVKYQLKPLERPVVLRPGHGRPVGAYAADKAAAHGHRERQRVELVRVLSEKALTA